MALTDHDLSELLAALKAGEMTDTLRSSLGWILQRLIDAEATAFIGAGLHERTDTRTALRKGDRPRLLSTPAGSGISKSEVSRICSELDRDLKAFRDRPLGHAKFD